MKQKNLIWLAVIAVGAFVVWKLLAPKQTAALSYQASAPAAGSGDSYAATYQVAPTATASSAAGVAPAVTQQIDPETGEPIFTAADFAAMRAELAPGKKASAGLLSAIGRQGFGKPHAAPLHSWGNTATNPYAVKS